mmetsp:Transcript_17063/g.47755  ORF Transcript_17063/g.47755 Transcript_17063/m.47755 type:complete len:148 (+) Transcript_17063:78-521(+)
MIVAVAVLGRENNPLYMRAFGELSMDSTATLRFHFIVHAAIDYIEEKLGQAKTSPGNTAPKLDMYLGFLYPIEEYRVYGYMTNSRVKLITVLDDEEVKDSEMRALFRRLHTLYVDTISNPFHKLDSELNGCASFEKQVGRVVEAGLY